MQIRIRIKLFLHQLKGWWNLHGVRCEWRELSFMDAHELGLDLRWVWATPQFWILGKWRRLERVMYTPAKVVRSRNLLQSEKSSIGTVEEAGRK